MSDKDKMVPGMVEKDDLPDLCPVCATPLQAEDMCLTDIELGICHAECLAGAPMVYLDTGEPIPEGEPAPTPFKYVEGA